MELVRFDDGFGPTIYKVTIQDSYQLDREMPYARFRQ